MFKIALIQNQSEMIRYNYADARSLFDYKEYDFDLFTGENIHQLADRLNRNLYDSIIIATNALNDKRIKETLGNQRKSLENYLKKPKGLLILHQIKMTKVDSFGFLPKTFDISAIDRKLKNLEERAIQGKLSVENSQKNHVVLTYPNKISLSDVQKKSLCVPSVEGLYWYYIKPINEKIWSSLIIDNSYNEKRNIMVVSRADIKPRIIITSLTLDWHRQRKFLENAVRYVTEGRHNTVVILKKGKTLFPFKYFLSSLKVAKIPHSVISLDILNFSDLPLNVHRTIVLDPAWTENEVKKSDLKSLTNFIQNSGELIHFGLKTNSFAKLPMTSIGGQTYLQTIKKNALVWIASNFKNKLWDDSFWCTIDVLQILDELNEQLDQYSHDVISYIKPHDIDGSYDEVFGTTIALMWVYHLFLGSKSKEFKQSLTWIKKRIDTCNLYEKAFAYDMLQKVGIPVEKEAIQEFKNEVLKQVQVLSELQAFRYGNTLLNYGFIQEACKIVGKLKELQHEEGRWIDVSTTAEVIRFLIKLRGSSQVHSEFDETIFNGIIYIREQFEDTKTFWGAQSSETIKAIVALKDFESLVIDFPTEQVNNLIRSSTKVEGSITALDSAIRVVDSLREENIKLQKNLDKKIGREKRLTKISLISLIISFSSLVLFILYLSYVIERGLLFEATSTIRNWINNEVILTFAIVFPILLLIYLLEKYRLLSKKMSTFVKKILNRFSIST